MNRRTREARGACGNRRVYLEALRIYLELKDCSSSPRCLQNFQFYLPHSCGMCLLINICKQLKWKVLWRWVILFKCVCICVCEYIYIGSFTGPNRDILVCVLFRDNGLLQNDLTSKVNQGIGFEETSAGEKKAEGC